MSSDGRSNRLPTGTVHFVVVLNIVALVFGYLVTALETVVIVLESLVFRLESLFFGLELLVFGLGNVIFWPDNFSDVSG